MKWNSGQPFENGQYLCAVVGNSNPVQLYWDGSVWSYMIVVRHEVGNDEVLYYMNLSDIPMPEGW